jgi:ribonuclease P protein component
MLAPARRLRRRTEFTATVRNGRRGTKGSLVVHVVIHSPVDSAAVDLEPVRAEPARAGFVVSRAVGNAVVRNKVKRRLRELVRDRLGDLPPGTDLVVRALPAAAERTYAEMGTDLDAALAAARRPRSPRGPRHSSAQERTG